MDIGDPLRTIIVEPARTPIPERAPAPSEPVPHREREAPHRKEPRPERTPERVPEKV